MLQCGTDGIYWLNVLFSMIDKVVIFAAGRGTRMGELSRETPKHLLEIFGRPFLFFLLTNLKQAGFKEVIMVTGHLAERFSDFVAEHKNEFPIFTVVNQFELLGQERYGTLMPLLAAQPQVAGSSFVVVMGDNLYALEDLRRFRELDDDYQYIAGLRVSDPSRYGTLVYDQENFLQRIDEKVPQPASDVINAGLYKFTPGIYRVTDQVKPAANGEYQITDAITLLAAQHQVMVRQLTQQWLDFGRPEDIKKTEAFIQQHDLFARYGILPS